VRRAAEAEQRQRGSFRELCEEWYGNEITGRGLKHPSVPRRHLDNYLLPKLGRTAASDVTPADIARVIDELKGRAPTAANDLLRFTRRIFAFGVRRRMVPNNPAADFSPRLDGGGTERPRSRALSLDELAQLFEKIRETPSFGPDNALALKLLLALCVRKGELLGARWEEFDLDGNTPLGTVWHLPASRTKTGASLDIPLVLAVVGWLREVKTLAAGSEYLFPKRRRDRRARAARRARYAERRSAAREARIPAVYAARPAAHGTHPARRTRGPARGGRALPGARDPWRRGHV